MMASVSLTQGQIFPAMSPLGESLVDLLGQKIVCTDNEHLVFATGLNGEYLYDNDGDYMIRTHNGQHAFTQDETGSLVRDQNGVLIPVGHGQLLYTSSGSINIFAYWHGVNVA